MDVDDLIAVFGDFWQTEINKNPSDAIKSFKFDQKYS